MERINKRKRECEKGTVKAQRGKSSSTYSLMWGGRLLLATEEEESGFGGQ